MDKKPIDLGKSPVHIGSNQQPAVPMADFAFNQSSFESYIAKFCADDPGRLIMVETTPSNWASIRPSTLLLVPEPNIDHDRVGFKLWV